MLAAAHGNTLLQVLYGALVLVGYVALVLVSPTRRCPRCRGHKFAEVRGRMVPCPKCRMAGRVKRLGATAIHRAFRRAFGDMLTERRKERISERRASQTAASAAAPATGKDEWA